MRGNVPRGSRTVPKGVVMPSLHGTPLGRPPLPELNIYLLILRTPGRPGHAAHVACVCLVGPACVRTLHVRFPELIVDLKPLLLLKTHGIFTDGIFRHVLHTHIEKQPYNHILKI